MINKALKCTIAIAAMCAAVGAAYADLTVSVNITGTIEELIPILQHLKDLGVGTGTAAASEDALKLNVHSIATGATTEAAPAPAPEAAPAPEPVSAIPPEPPKPALGLLNLKAEPAAPKPGDIVQLSVQVSDPDHKIDTVAVTVTGPEGDAKGVFDLYDNGTHGDATANDGLWSTNIGALGPAARAGETYTLMVVAYDANGDPVMTAGEGGAIIPLKAEAGLTVQAPAAK
ncbi:MAG: hypothetical protein HY706_03370 [Candidatus Hydrogenedentes bacterium]|nr:hypothetical protein [Candidatus Hydrogenedentota bacterium]